MDVENEICENCKVKGSIIMNYDVEQLVCNNCGLVCDKKIIADEDEKRTFENDEGDNQIHRVGPPMNQVCGNECGVDFMFRINGKTKYEKSDSMGDGRHPPLRSDNDDELFAQSISIKQYDSIGK